MEFKVGDKVRIVRDTIFSGEYHVGDVCEVKSIGSDEWIHLAMADRGCQQVSPDDYDCIEKVEENTMKYKVGDRINVTSDANGNHRIAKDVPEDTTLIIEHHRRTTVAHIGKTYGVARCNPDDKYDAMTGDILAVQRLYAKKAPKKKIIVNCDGTAYGVVGTPTIYYDTNTGKTLNIGDCVDVVRGRAVITHSFMAHNDKDFVMGLKSLPQKDFVKIVKVDGDEAMKDRGFEVVSE